MNVYSARVSGAGLDVIELQSELDGTMTSMNERQYNLWVERKGWPISTSKAIFLLQALLELAPLLSEEWEGDEPCCPDPLFNERNMIGPIPWRNKMTVGELWEAEKIVQAAGLPPFRRTEVVTRFGRIQSVSHELNPTNEEWARAVRLVKTEDEIRSVKKRRFLEIKRRMVEALLEGELIAVLRPTSGGAYSGPLAPHLWNTERWGPRFLTGQMNPLDPFGSGIAGDKFQYIFIERESLDRFAAKLKVDSNAGTKKTVASETQAIDRLARQLRQTPDMTQAQARELCKDLKVSDRGFRDRIWPAAREKAGLSRQGKPGRPRKG